MAHIITKERAYALASQWGSFMTNSDPGACMYCFHFGDGRPVDEDHRSRCLDWLRRREPDNARDAAELRQLTAFIAAAPLGPQ